MLTKPSRAEFVRKYIFILLNDRGESQQKIIMGPLNFYGLTLIYPSWLANGISATDLSLTWFNFNYNMMVSAL